MTFTFQEIDNGCDLVEWVRRVVLPRVKRTAGNTRYLFPDPLLYLRELSQAHSWYKHLHYQPGKFFPVIREGVPENPTILSNKRKRPDDLQALYWTFACEDALYARDSQTPEKVTDWPVSVLRRHSFYAGVELSSFTLAPSADSDSSKLLAQCVLLECEKLCDIIVRALLSIDQNPPSEQRLLFQISLDKFESEDEEGLCIANRFYKWYYHPDLSWSMRGDVLECANSLLYKDTAPARKDDGFAADEATRAKKELKIQPIDQQE